MYFGVFNAMRDASSTPKRIGAFSALQAASATPSPHPLEGKSLLSSVYANKFSGIHLVLGLTLLTIKCIIIMGGTFLRNVRFIPFNMKLNLLTKKNPNTFQQESCIPLNGLIMLCICNSHLLLVLGWESSVGDLIPYLFPFGIRCTKIVNKIVYSGVRRIMLVAIMFVSGTRTFSSEIRSVWYFTLILLLSSDVHPNPGPSICDNYTKGFLSFCNWNLNTLSKENFYRGTLLEAHNVNFNYDIISLCETSLNDTIIVDENLIPGYKFFPWNNPDGTRNGGVGIFYKETLPLRIREDLSFDECLVAELRFGRKKIFFTVLYRNPASKANSPEFEIFIQNFENLSTNIRKEKPYAMFFTGDFNGHTQAWYPDGDTNEEGTRLDDIFTSLNLSQIIQEPTHFFRDDCQPSCIDLIVTDQPNLILDSGVRPSLDPTVKHQIIYCKINFIIPPLPNYERKIWHYNRAQIDQIGRAFSEFSWDVHLQALPDTTSQVKFLNNFIHNVMSNFVPNETRKIRPRDPEWMNGHIRSKLRKQNKLYKKFRKNGFKNEDKIVLDKFRVECSEAIHNTRENYLKKQGEKLADPKTAQKTYWKILNSFLSKCKIPRIPPLFIDGNFIVNCKDRAKIFNDYFASQCTPFVNDSILPPLSHLTGSRICKIDISDKDISDILSGLNVNKSHGPDGISGNMIKLCGPHLVKPLKIIFSNVLKTGKFPDQWKEANVTPVHKKKDKQLHSNYRPISLLPLLAKVFEKIIFKYLYNHFTSNNLISKNQSGFRPGDSCTNQLLSLTNDIHAAFDDRHCLEVRAVYLDMSKAFDKVWHEGLIFKLKQNGVGGNVLALLTDYLYNRKQRVVLNGVESDWATIYSGVPQGSVLGPLLFLIFINDLEDGIKSHVKFFADDTSLFSIVRDPIKSATELNHDLNVIAKWAYQWKMSFNPDPTKPAEEVLFSCKKQQVEHPPLFFNNVEVKRVTEHKHLGLVMDSKLKFIKHINEKVATARKWIGVIKHVSKYLPLKSLDQIYKMNVRSLLDYCDIIFHIPVITHDFDSSLTLNYLMNILEKTQYQAALAVSGCWKGTNTDKIYEELGWESLDQRRFFHRLVMFYKIVNNLTPEYLKQPIPPLQCRYGMRSKELNYVRCRTDRYLNFFYSDALKSWNNIGVDMRNAKSLSIFKNTLLKIIRPSKKDVFNVHDSGLRWIFQLRVGLSHLRQHKKNHNFLDTFSDLCSCRKSTETTQHFLLECSLFDAHRRDILTLLENISFTRLDNMSPTDKVHLLLYGHESFNNSENCSLLKATINFIRKSGRFSQETDEP